MKNMKAVGYYNSLPIEDANSLVDVQVPIPITTGHDLLVEIKGVSVNPVDTLQRSEGQYHADTPKILGYDAVGIVREVGDETTLFRPGDRVFYAGDLTRSGSDSEFQLVDERIVGHAPVSLSDAQAAAVPLTGITAWEALFEVLGIDATQHGRDTGKSILLINGAGGAGSMTIQLAKWAGLHVIASASRPETIAWVNKLGADEVVNHRNDLVQELHKHGHQTVDYIFDMHSVDRHWHEMTTLIAPRGKIVSITRDNVPVNLSELKNKRASFGWELMFSKSMYPRADLITQHEILDKIAYLADQKLIISTMTQSLSPINAKNLKIAHRLVESQRMIGKIVVTD